MTLAHGTDRLESARLVLRRVVPGDLPFYTRLHANSDVARDLFPGGRTRSPEETAAWMTYTLASYEQYALGYLAVLRKADGALIAGAAASWTWWSNPRRPSTGCGEDGSGAKNPL